MEVKLFILFFLLISITKVHGTNFKIDVIQEGATEKNKLTLVKGRYTKIFIKFTSDNIKDYTTNLITTITFSDKRFKLTDESISIDTSKFRGVQTNIGIPCSASFGPDELKNGVTAWFDSHNKDNLSISNITISIIEETTTIRIEHSAGTIPFKGAGGFFISSELLNVDPIIISSDFNKNYTDDFEIEGEKIYLESNYEKFGHYNKITKYYSKTDKSFEGIEIKFKLENEDTISKCYEIENPTITIKVSDSESISDTNNKKFPLIGPVYEREMWITSISSKLVPSFIDCAIISEGHDFPTNEQILAQQEIDGIPSSELKYIQQAIGTNHPNINFVSTTLSRVKDYKYKCIYQNNANEEKAKTFFEFIGDNRINYLRTQKVMPTCLDLYFETLENPEEFDLKIINYFFNAVINKQNDITSFDFAYTKFSTRNIKDYYNDTSILKSYCGYIDEVSTTNIGTKLSSGISGVFRGIGGKLSTLHENCILTKNEIVSFSVSDKKLESYSLNIEIYEHSKDRLKVNVESNENIHMVCDCIVEAESDTSQLILDENQRLVFDKLEKKENIEIKFPSSKEFDKKQYYLVFKCNPLVGFDYLFSFIPTYRFTHSQENSFNCLTNLKVPECADIYSKKNTPSGLPKLTLISPLDQSISEYKKKSFKEKSGLLHEHTIGLAITPPKLDVLPQFYTFLSYMENYKCLYALSYKNCRETKKKYQESVIPVFEKIFVTNNTLVELYNSIEESQKILEYITLSFYLLFLEGNNGDGFNKNSMNAFMNVYQKFLNEYSNILSYMDENKESAQYKDAVQQLFPLIITNVQNIFTHMEADNLFKNKSITEDQKESYVIQDESLKQYKKMFTSTLAPYYIKNNIKEETFENFKFYYRPLGETVLRNLENVREQTYSFGDINVTVPINSLVSDEKIKGLVFYIYERYPLLSVVSSEKYSQIISIRRYNENDTITDEDVSLFQSANNSIKVTYSKKKSDKIVPNCIYFMNDTITNKSIITSVNPQSNTITCSASFLADIGIENNDADIPIPSDEGLTWWMILSICILCLCIATCFVFLGYYCFCYKRKNNTLHIDIEQQGKILNDVSEARNSST